MKTRTKRQEGADEYDRALAESLALLIVRVEDSIRSADAVAEELRAIRAALAFALNSSGLPMEDVAGVFGVTRQRISQLVREVRQSLDADPEKP